MAAAPAAAVAISEWIASERWFNALHREQISQISEERIWFPSNGDDLSLYRIQSGSDSNNNSRDGFFFLFVVLNLLNGINRSQINSVVEDSWQTFDFRSCRLVCSRTTSRCSGVEGSLEIIFRWNWFIVSGDGFI